MATDSQRAIFALVFFLAAACGGTQPPTSPQPPTKNDPQSAHSESNVILYDDSPFHTKHQSADGSTMDKVHIRWYFVSSSSYIALLNGGRKALRVEKVILNDCLEFKASGEQSSYTLFPGLLTTINLSYFRFKDNKDSKLCEWAEEGFPADNIKEGFIKRSVPVRVKLISPDGDINVKAVGLPTYPIELNEEWGDTSNASNVPWSWMP